MAYKTRLSAIEISQIQSLWAANWSLLSISQETNRSVSTIQRVLKQHPAPKGELVEELTKKARKAMLEKYASSDAITALYASFINDTVSHIALAREISAQIALQLLDDKDLDNTQKLRGIAAHSTTLKNHSDILRSLLPKPESLEELPILRIGVMTDEDIAEIRRKQLLEAEGYDACNDDDNDQEQTG
jgi:IS30 family transposase